MDLRRALITITYCCVAFAPPDVFAQEKSKVARIGFLSPLEQTYQVAFFETLQKFGYIEGRNINIERRFAGGHDERLASLAAELVHLNVNAIVATNSAATAAAIRATRAIPIIMVTGGDPVAAGFVSSLSHPGGNVTGTISLSSDIGLKQLQLLRDALPHIKRVAILADRNNPAQKPFLEELRVAAPKLGFLVDVYEVQTPQQLDPALELVARNRPQALLVPAHPVTIARRKDVIAFAGQHRLPALYTLKEFAEDGGLISFGPSFSDLYRRAAWYTDKVLRGAKPAELAIEQPNSFDLLVNLKTARALGITIPQSILLRSDRVIE